jgi:hypothetical protein
VKIVNVAKNAIATMIVNVETKHANVKTATAIHVSVESKTRNRERLSGLSFNLN